MMTEVLQLATAIASRRLRLLVCLFLHYQPGKQAHPTRWPIVILEPFTTGGDERSMVCCNYLNIKKKRKRKKKRQKYLISNYEQADA